MKRIVAALDSAFAASADDLYDSLYGGGKEQSAPEQYTRASHWENIPTDSHIQDQYGIAGRYHVTPEEHTMLYNWRGPNGEQVEYHPEASDYAEGAKYTIEHEVPGRGTKYHNIRPPLEYDHPDVDMGVKDWHHSYTWSDPNQQENSGIVEGNWPSFVDNIGKPEKRTGTLKKVLDNVHRLNGGEPLGSVYPWEH